MCGIAGIVDPITPPSRDLLESMAESLVKRGPDDFGWHLREAFGLAHRRLSIIDLEGGRQPIFNEDRTMAIIANGEIYDFAALRDELKVRGHRFATGSDSEVLLHLYEEERERMMVRLNGMFAFAIADFERQELFIARDRLGQKPMFYAHRDQRFAFGSGPASLCGLPWVDDAIDESAIHDYLDYYYVPAPRSIYRGIHKLMPGSWLRFSAGKVEQESYWTPMLHGSFGGTYEDAQEVLRCREQVLDGVDIEVQQPRQRQVDLHHFRHRQPLVQAAQPLDLRRLQGQRRVRPQPGPGLPREGAVGRDAARFAAGLPAFRRRLQRGRLLLLPRMGQSDLLWCGRTSCGAGRAAGTWQ